LGKLFGPKDVPKEAKNLAFLRKEYNLKLGKNIRFVDTTRFVHCHNKMVLVDGKGILVGSQNWSNSAVTTNREASLWLEHSGICRYFSRIFESDWKTARQKLPGPEPQSVRPESLTAGGFVRVVPADYQEV
jgi:phosphatidylserine/phosphatidylglycerophosphate/cardiolipin synthase-like enzyme